MLAPRDRRDIGADIPPSPWPVTDDYRWLKENQTHALWFIAENDYLQHFLNGARCLESRTLGFQTGLQHLQYARDLSVKVANV